MHHLEHIAKMSPVAQAAAEKYWDETGRPNYDRPHALAICSLLNNSVDFDQFKALYAEVF